MSLALNEYEIALKLFLLQIKCVETDDRITQMGIYVENLHYEFPFANDRQKIIDGRETFRKVMEPIWERRRRNNIKISLGKYEFHSTEEPGLYLAIFELKAINDEQNEPISSPCVQLLRITNGFIVEVREYFEP